VTIGVRRGEGKRLEVEFCGTEKKVFARSGAMMIIADNGGMKKICLYLVKPEPIRNSE
jgi:hypothetical protein